MSKQTEIIRVVEAYFEQAGSPARKEILTRAMLKDLARIGVVKRVDRKFPEHILPEATDELTARYNQGYLNGQVIMIEAGYGFFKPLIK